jgi:hypothetical protein
LPEITIGYCVSFYHSILSTPFNKPTMCMTSCSSLPKRCELIICLTADSKWMYILVRGISVDGYKDRVFDMLQVAAIVTFG